MPVEKTPDGMVFHLDQGIDGGGLQLRIRGADIPPPQACEPVASVQAQKIDPILPFQDVALQHPLVPADLELLDRIIVILPENFECDQGLLLLGKGCDSHLGNGLLPGEGVIGLEEKTREKDGTESSRPEQDQKEVPGAGHRPWNRRRLLGQPLGHELEPSNRKNKQKNQAQQDAQRPGQDQGVGSKRKKRNIIAPLPYYR